MKTKSTSRFLLLIPLLLLCSCVGLGNAILETAATLAGLGAQWAVTHYPAQRSQFIAAEKSLTVWLETGTTNAAPLDLAKLTDILSSLSLGQAGWGDQGQLYLQAGLFIWDIAKGVNYQVTSQPAIRLVGTRIRDGFARGLAQPMPRQMAPPLPREIPTRSTKVKRI